MSNSVIPACPACSKRDDVFIKCRAYGWATQYYSVESGATDNFDISEVLYVDSKTIHCASCQAIRRDLVIDGESVRVKP